MVQQIRKISPQAGSLGLGRPTEPGSAAAYQRIVEAEEVAEDAMTEDADAITTENIDTMTMTMAHNDDCNKTDDEMTLSEDGEAGTEDGCEEMEDVVANPYPTGSNFRRRSVDLRRCETD